MTPAGRPSKKATALARRLREYARRYETAAFLEGDPSWFMHQVKGDRDREIMAFIASALSYGSRKQFFPKVQYLLEVSEGHLYDWLTSGRYTGDVPDVASCYYRLYTYHKMNGFLKVLRRLYEDEGSMGAFVARRVEGVPVRDRGLKALEEISGYFFSRGVTGIVPRMGSTCKRLCMFLRWMCRDGSPVDLGLWSGWIDKRYLFMPLDTHVMQVSTRLGLIRNKTASWSTVVQLTEALRKIFPDDPVKGDFALFGYAMDKDTDRNTDSRTKTKAKKR